MPAKVFQKRFLTLILLTWVVPPVIGISFLLYIQMFTVEQMAAILIGPIEPVFIVVSVIFTLWYFNRYAQPIYAYLEQPTADRTNTFMICLRRFPAHYWGLFLAYLVIAPVTVIISAEQYAGFTPTPIDWFRINLVALIVSIIVGLPIFFRILDLFGRLLTNIRLNRPHVTIKLKVFLIGALVPLLVDTMIVQYYWAKTGHFTRETFAVWITLELLAIGGSLIFVKSFSQSLHPLHNAIEQSEHPMRQDYHDMVPHSTDELGVLTSNYRELLQRLKGYQHRLEKLVAQRTGELESANKELESFCYSVSHDLRAPLRAIKGFSEILMEDYETILDEQGQEYLRRISGGIDKMGQLIDALLALSRITTQETKPEPVHLSELAKEVVGQLQEMEPDRHVTINIEDELAATGDKTLLKVALDNLFNNAWKYTRKSPDARIRFGFSREQLAYYIADNGVGFDMKYADKLFTAFQRLHNTEEFEGTGIGLTTVQRVIGRHHGEIWAESRMGEGSTFYFTLGTTASADEPLKMPSTH
ncbi:MAG: ATP-binding protein [Gammaproteobacteria bacterium]|jgi:signal transduction histidine kinase